MASPTHSGGQDDAQAIFDAGVVIIVDTALAAQPKIFLGRRQPDNVFLPGKWVFPGGRSEADDLAVPAADPLADGDIAALRFGMSPPWTERQATALALTAVREVFEETGLAIGAPGVMAGAVPTAWAAFAASGLRPALSPLRFIARAITPPGRPRRYDTRFFLCNATAIGASTGRHDGEFTEQGWFTLPQCRALDLPNITRLILDDASELLDEPAGGLAEAVPFYYQLGGAFRRDLIPRQSMPFDP